MTEGNYLPIQSLDIEAETKINFNLYVNLPLNNRYILYRRAGGSIETHKMERLSEGNLSNFFIEKKDYMEFVKYVATRIKALVGPQSSPETRKVMEAAAKSILSSTLNQNDPAIAAALMSNLNDITGMVIESALENSAYGSKKLFQRLFQLSQKGTDFQKHPVNVASLAVLITFGIGYSRDKTLSDVAMAGVLHDIGLSRLSPKLIQNAHNVVHAVISDRELLYKHPQVSLDILEEKRIPVSDITKTLILQHHEEFNGNGYPNGLRGFNVHELAQVLRVADELDQTFTEFCQSPTDLKARVGDLMIRLAEQKVIAPTLLERIRRVLV